MKKEDLKAAVLSQCFTLALAFIKAALAEAKPEERILVWESLQEGYCVHCGTAIEGRSCYCTRDE